MLKAIVVFLFIPSFSRIERVRMSDHSENPF